MAPFEVDLTVYPDECDASGHLNQASFSSLFERARWEMLAKGPGMDLFTRTGSWPALRRATIEFQAPAFPGDVLRFTQTLVHRGRTSFTMRQSARRPLDETMIASAEFVFVCIDRAGKPVPVPEGLDALMVERGGEAKGSTRVTVNGVSLALDDAGDGPCILFIHGYPLDRTIWRDQLENLKGWRRLAPDLRGLGESDAPDLGYSMATYAADLFALLDSLGIRQVVICALSMGGYVAFEMLRAQRDRVLGVVLMATRAEADSSEARRARDAAAAVARERGAEAIAGSMLPRLLAPASNQNGAVVNRVRALISRAPVAGIVGALTAMRERVDSSSLLPGLVGLPTLVVAGESDQLIPLPDVTRMHDALVNSVLRVVPNAGHLLPVEQPGATTQILQEFLDGLAETGVTSRA
jgi:YbgC/YbaW family acyl-CoA thioester hydrolase